MCSLSTADKNGVLKMTKRTEFDVVLWGGSSFVGKLIAEHLHQHYGVGESLCWAMGGRNKRKLDATRASLGAGADQLPIIVGDARDRQLLGSLVENTKVVLSTKGEGFRDPLRGTPKLSSG